jgi:lipopolysaccharide/colanic/teichoic acid biosynthesis glycosyltransferase
VPDAARLDRYYVENWSLQLDVAVLWRTIGAVVSGRGAY